MKILEKKVYYCDFCNKHMLTSYGMKRHESKCISNPKRICTAPYCIAPIHTDQKLIDWVMEKSILAHDGIESSNYAFDDKELVQELRGKLDGCPICTVAVLMQVKIQQNSKGNSFYWMYDLRPDAKQMYAEWLEDNSNWY